MIGQLARRMDTLRASEIRELLKVTERAEVISFGGGLPAPESFPVAAIGAIVETVIERHGPAAMQYSTTEGYRPLRDKIAARVNRRLGTSVTAEDLVVTVGSQQALDLTGKLFLDEGDEVLCESPTYLGAINALRAYSPTFVEVVTDEQGMVIADLERRLAACRRPKLIYVVPDFQNPSGRCWSRERREALLEVAARHRLPVIEDAPYRDLRYEGDDVPALLALDRDGVVTHLGTFSKIFAPGMRIGWVAAREELRDRYVLVKQGADLHTPTFTQMMLDAYLESGALEGAVERIRSLYRSRRDAIIAALEDELGDHVRFTRPAGGLFLWLELPEEINARELLALCLERGVAFVPGGSFFPNGGHENTLRLNYSNSGEARIVEGVRRMAGALREQLAARRAVRAMG